MKYRNNKNKYYLLILLCFGLISSCISIRAQSIESGRIKVDSSLYWNFKGQRTLLLGAFNHGHNPFIDGSTLDGNTVDSMDSIISQIQEMVDVGGNTLRCVLDPGKAASFGLEAYKKNSEGLYDLNHPVGQFWDRLLVFIEESEKRNVIVELEIWDRFDWATTSWDSNPFNPVNNINYSKESSGLAATYVQHSVYRNHPMSKGVSGHPVYDSASIARKAQYDLVRKYQEIFVSKVLSCAFPHNNIIYNMNNETSEPAAWGEYWMRFIKSEAKNAKVSVVCTNMVDGAYLVPDSKEISHQLDHPELYDYLDVSQVNSRLRNEIHWNKIKWIADQAKSKGLLLHMTKLYGSDDRLPGPWESWKPGDSDNAIEEWWRNLIAGVAGVRFHRPTSGIGLSDKAKACILATRIVEDNIKFWDVSPKIDLLSDRDEDEAYLAANPGKEYILYLTHKGGGSVGLNLENYNARRFKIIWINIDRGICGPESIIMGGNIVRINRPDDSAHWVAAISRME